MEHYRLQTTDTYLKHRNGQKVQITEHITEPTPEFDAEVLPMMRIRFGDGYVTEVWPDELLEYTARGPVYRDLL